MTDRLVGLIAAMVIESSLDRLLQSIAPGFKASGFTFAVKIKIAESLQLLPARILDACDFIGQVRNKFAHNVQLTRFEDLPPDIDFLQTLSHLRKGSATRSVIRRNSRCLSMVSSI